MSENQTMTALRRHREALSRRTIASLFQRSPRRFEECSLRCGDLFLDYSRNPVTAETMALLEQLAVARDLARHRDALLTGRFAGGGGAPAALHTVLRNPARAAPEAGAAVRAPQRAFLDFAERVRSGALAAPGGQPLPLTSHRCLK